MARPVGMFDGDERRAGLTKKGDDLERLAAVVDVELVRRARERAVARAERAKGGRPRFDQVLMCKVLILQTQTHLRDERTAFDLRDRLTGMGFLGLGRGASVPHANTIGTLREALTRAGAIQRLFEVCDRERHAAGDRARSGQRVDARIIAAPTPRTTRAEKQALQDGRGPEAWQAKPAKLRQKDRAARWPVTTTTAKPRAGESPMVARAIFEFGYQNHVSAARRHRWLRRWLVTDAAAHAGTGLSALLAAGTTAAAVRADTADRASTNEDLLRHPMRVSHIHRRKPAGRPMPVPTARANASKSAIRAHIEPICAEPKHRIGLVVRTLGRARATIKIGLANLADNRRRRLGLERPPARA